MDSERTEEYLEAIYRRQTKKMPVATSSLAEDLKVSPPAVTDMLRHLDKQGLIEYKSSKGTILTDLGTEKALGVIRRHRLWERFLTDILGIKWDKVHDEACKLEHVSSPDIEKGLATILGNADSCPHGHSIPDQNGNIKDEKIVPLSKLRPGQKVCILAIAREDPKLLRALEKLGLRPKTTLTIVKKDKDGLLEVEVNQKRLPLKDELATSLLVKPIIDEESTGVVEEIPLSKLTTGQSGVIRSYTGKRGMLGRCLSLGFTPGSLVKMIENYNRGPVLVRIHDTEVALGHGLVEKIMVTRNGDVC